MRTITVNKTELMRILEKNRGEHRATFEKAQEVYRQKMVEELDRMLDETKRGDKIRRAFALPEPEDHTDDYDRAIGMLAMHTEDTIELWSNEYQMFVQDEWGWQQSFAANTASYVAIQK